MSELRSNEEAAVVEREDGRVWAAVVDGRQLYFLPTMHAILDEARAEVTRLRTENERQIAIRQHAQEAHAAACGALAATLTDLSAARAEVSQLRALPENCATISAAVTASYPDGMDPELVMRRRVGKVFVEAGELMDAIEGWTGENPRKGVYATRAEVVKELLDCASASLCAVEHLTGDHGLSLGMLADQVAGNTSRLAAALAEPLGSTEDPPTGAGS